MTASLGTIRQFLVAHFNDEELDQLCFDYFYDVQQHFGTGMSANRKAMLLIEHCHHRDLLPSLLVALRKERPEPYQRVFGRQLSPTIRQIDINSATAEELQNLPNIGPDLARAIIAVRPFDTVDDLTHVPGIGPKRLAAVREWCSV